MTIEHTDTEPKTASPGSSQPDDDRLAAAWDKLAALQAELDERGVKVYNNLTPEQWVLLGTASLYAHFYFKSFVETLGKRHADAVADLMRIRKNGKKTEAEVGLPGGESPKVVLVEGMSDLAWLALFDIALAAEDLRGKTLRWDSGTSTWRPADD